MAEEKNTKESNMPSSADEVEILDELLENIPEEHRRSVEKLFISRSVQMREIVSPENTVMNKITSEHVSTFLDASREEMKHTYQEMKHRKIFTFATIVTAMIFFVIIIILLKDNPDVMEKVLYTVGGVVIGAFGGYGFGKNSDS